VDGRSLAIRLKVLVQVEELRHILANAAVKFANVHWGNV